MPSWGDDHKEEAYENPNWDAYSIHTSKKKNAPET